MYKTNMQMNIQRKNQLYFYLLYSIYFILAISDETSIIKFCKRY